MQVNPTNSSTITGAQADEISVLPTRHPSPPPLPSTGTVSAEAVRRGGAMELTLRNASGAAGIVTESHEASQERFDALLTLARSKMIKGNHELPGEFEARVMQRARRMHERGDNPHQLEAMFTFASFGIDLPADVLDGFAKGAPFAFANLIAKFLPAMDPAKGGALSGAITILSVHLLGPVFGAGGETPRWGNTTKPLEGILPEDDPRNNPLTAADVFKKIGLTFQLFPLSFGGSGAVNSAIANADLDAGLKAQYGIGPSTALVGSGIVGGAGNLFDHYAGRTDPGRILSEEDWEGSLDELKQATFKDATGNGLKHVFSKDTLARMGTGLADAVIKLPNLSTLAQATVWTGGISLYSYVTAEINKNPNLSESDKFIRQQMMFAAALVPITFFWTAAIAIGPALDRKAGAALAKVWEALPQWKREQAQLQQSAGQ
ncbi:hypothetical protein J8I26_04070 [Herbaspirillum sp. LeCh32-8]|uniref:hypothetical protein n=1 Tax=Herbaspirillum sp. LeCh32-8 TaxID=2821356 RepID=UPI001AE6248F|nr:hypothetical protein [Herbaspirillum sp. LeCh32-8]MBP0597266.1 hypothetical protein [Herbaspirillum sp. LeCh32-8]